MLDVYICFKNHEFAVKDGQEPNCCPFCGSRYIEFSHEADPFRMDYETEKYSCLSEQEQSVNSTRNILLRS